MATVAPKHNSTDTSTDTITPYQIENDGNITVTNCAFDNVSLTPLHTGASTEKSLTVTNSKFTNNQKAGIRGINSKTVSVSGCTFTDCASGAVDFVKNDKRSDGDIVLLNNVINGANAFKLRDITNKVYVKGDDTSINVDTFFSYDIPNTYVTQYLIIYGGTYNINPSEYTTWNATYKDYVVAGYRSVAIESSKFRVMEIVNVTVSADNAQKVYGADDPKFTATVTGLENGDAISYNNSHSEAYAYV